MIYDVIIIGAGLAGLKAARDLQAAGMSVLILDKGRGLGGRAATRRWDGVAVDHGAQFFTARSDAFRGQTHDWVSRGVCFEWARGFHQWDDAARGLRAPGNAPGEEHVRYACRGGMSALGKDLAAGLLSGTVHLGARVKSIQSVDGTWLAALENAAADDDVPAGRRLIITAPMPQVLALIDDPARPGNRLAVDQSALGSLKTVETAPALAVMLRGTAPAPGWKGVQLRDGTLSWIGFDSDKRPPAAGAADVEQERVFVLHGSPAFSREWQDTDLERAADRMVARAGEIVGEWITRLPARQVHRWRFASVVRGLPEQGFMRPGVAGSAPLYVAGDAFRGAKIEGAYLSGLEVAKAIVEGG